MQVITEQSVNRVLNTVTDIAGEGNEQLTLLALALVTACSTCEVPKEAAMMVLNQMFDEHMDIRQKIMARRTLN